MMKIKNVSQISDADMDCQWNFDCGMGTALFHQSSQEDLGRVSGWLQTAHWRHAGKAIVFIVWGSVYASDMTTNADGTSSGSEAASKDYAATVGAEAFTASSCPAFALPAAQVQCFKARGDGSAGNPKSDRYWTITWWDGTAETELAAYANTDYTEVRKAFYALVGQTMTGMPDATAATTAGS
jgi:hypothetical protein